MNPTLEKIIQLTKELNYLNYQYYKKDIKEISDQAFDFKLKTLEQLERNHPSFVQPDSPTLRVGGFVSKKFETVAHQFPMLSLSNTYSKQDLMDFDEYLYHTLEAPPHLNTNHQIKNKNHSPQRLDTRTSCLTQSLDDYVIYSSFRSRLYADIMGPCGIEAIKLLLKDGCRCLHLPIHNR